MTSKGTNITNRASKIASEKVEDVKGDNDNENKSKNPNKNTDVCKRKILSMEIKPGCVIYNNRTIFFKDTRTLALADLHLGYEGAMEKDGVLFPKCQLNIIKKELSKIIKKHHPREIVIVGDVKHELSGNIPQEWKEVMDFLDFILNSKCKLVIVKGNHDHFLESMINKSKLYKDVNLVESYQVGNFLFLHGHKSEKEYFKEDKEDNKDRKRIVVMGHEHPSILLRDEVGARLKLHCFLVGKNVIVLPAFSPLASGVDVNCSEFMSPILRNIDLEREGIKVIATTWLGLLDFTTLHKLRMIKY